ncbi:MAG: hypothetical protein N2035_00850 [Chthoniobacterales bacterium]|nr:hypothetical protein [Chthoniobacterales bacterium]
MPIPLPFNLIPLTLIALTCLPFHLLSATPSPSPSPPPQNQNSQKFDLPIAKGQDILGIRAPIYDETNTLIALIEAELARKESDQLISFQNVSLELYDDIRRKLHIHSPLSQLDTNTLIISTNSGITITRDDFSIQSNFADFDIQKQILKLSGPTKMTIFSADSLQP